MLRVFNIGDDDGENYVLSIADHADSLGEQVVQPTPNYLLIFSFK